MATVGVDDLAAVQRADGIRSLTLEGATLRSDIASLITDIVVDRTIDGAPTVAISAHDTDRVLLRSGLLSQQAAVSLGGVGYELVQVRKTGPDLTLTCEDMVVSALKRRTTPLKVAPGTTTHVEFARRLVAEEGWIGFVTWPDLAETAKVELSRGDPGGTGEPESSWAAMGRLADERGWRRWVRDGSIYYLPETFLLLGEPKYRLSEDSRAGVDSIDFDFDQGKEIATVSVTARIGRWDVPVGEVVEIAGLGPADGKWIVAGVNRSVYSLTAAITLTKARPVLPEPEPPPEPATAEQGESGYGPSGGTASEPGTASGQIRTIIDAALSRDGTPYIWGGKTTAGFDCSGLLSWACAQGGKSFPGGSKNQKAACAAAGTLISVDAAVGTYGALLFRMVGEPTHDAFSLGNGRTMEARGKAYGCGSFSATQGRNWTHGARIPGVAY